MSDQARARAVVEQRFTVVFAHLGLVADYARRRGVVDPEGIAAEVMAIAWRRLADVPGTNEAELVNGVFGEPGGGRRLHSATSDAAKPSSS